MLLICPVLLPITWNCRIFSFILWSGLSYFRILTICLLLAYFVSAAGCHCFDRYFYPPEDPDDYRFDIGNEHELVADVDAQTLIKLVKFLKRGKAPGPDNIHNEVLRLGTTTSLYHHLARLFTSSIQLGYISTSWKIATLHMFLKPDKLPFLTTSYRPISLISSIIKLFERVIEQRLRHYDIKHRETSKELFRVYLEMRSKKTGP